MKRFVALIVSLTIIGGILGGCAKKSTQGSDSEMETDSYTTETSAKAEDAGLKGKNIGVCIYKFDDNFMTLYRNELQNYLEEQGANVTIMDGKNDQAEQTGQITNYITQGVDLLIINLVQSSAAETVATQCADAGIPVVFINREPDITEEERWKAEDIQATYVGADARQSGTFQGEIVLGLEEKGDINGDGKVGYVMVQGDMENVDAQYRTEFSIKALEDAGVAVEKVDEQRGDWDQAKGQEIVANALTANGDAVEVVFCNNDAMALGALQAIEAAGRVVGEDIYLLGVDALTEALQNIQNEKMTGTVFNDHIGQSHKTAEVAAQMLNGEKVESTYMVDYIKVTSDNVQEIMDLLK